MAGKKGMKHYSIAFKTEAIRMRQEKGMTNREIMEQLGIVSERRLRLWCEKYRNEGQHALEIKPKGRPRKIARTEQEEAEYELRRLRMENELLRNFLYEAGRR
jgi:transposase-like protein